MKKIICNTVFIVATIFSLQAYAQNVGIGTTTPNQKLHVAGNLYVKDSLGIGVDVPKYKLDVGGRMRLKSKGDGNVFESAGIWFNDVFNSTSPAFIGMQSNSNIGFYASGLGDWALSMNTNTGNIGIGTVAYNGTQKLAVGGNTYIRDKLGIGIQNPISTLDVAGDMRTTTNLVTQQDVISGAVSTTEDLYVLGNIAAFTLTAANNIFVNGSVSMGLDYISQTALLESPAQGEYTCNCPPGKKAISGGGGGTRNTAFLISSGPTNDGNGWTVRFNNPLNQNRTVDIKYWAICARIQ
jgi:hypothetical protein